VPHISASRAPIENEDMPLEGLVDGESMDSEGRNVEVVDVEKVKA